MRRTWASIDLDALGENYRAVRRAAGEAMVCAVVKADAYGHGAVRVAAELDALGADWFAVSNLEEAAQLRRAGLEKPLLILGYTPPEQAAVLAGEQISQCVYSTEYARTLAENARAQGVTVRMHVKIDTGMGRLGFSCRGAGELDAAVEEAAAVCGLPGLFPEGIFTHFAVSDGGARDEAFTRGQFACFTGVIAGLERRGIAFAVRHCANSAAIFDYPETRLDMVRAGIVLYGLAPSEETRRLPNLTPALALQSVVSHVKTVEPGATVSYGRTYTAPARQTIATVPVGYADGYPRLLGPGGAQALVRGCRCPVVGRVCMDQLMLDVSAAGQVEIGDTVTLLGRDGEGEVTAGELARREGTIAYEVVCAISKRVPRVYWKNGAVDSVYDPLLTE